MKITFLKDKDSYQLELYSVRVDGKEVAYIQKSRNSPGTYFWYALIDDIPYKTTSPAITSLDEAKKDVRKYFKEFFN